jgi:hypothetical protein
MVLVGNENTSLTFWQTTQLYPGRPVLAVRRQAMALSSEIIPSMWCPHRVKMFNASSDAGYDLLRTFLKPLSPWNHREKEICLLCTALSASSNENTLQPPSLILRLMSNLVDFR